MAVGEEAAAFDGQSSSSDADGVGNEQVTCETGPVVTDAGGACDDAVEADDDGGDVVVDEDATCFADQLFLLWYETPRTKLIKEEGEGHEECDAR